MVSPKIYLHPFLAIIKSDKTSGSLTSIALTSVYKVLSYGLLCDQLDKHELSVLVEKIADAATHTRFYGTDQASDGVVLLKVVQLLRQLMLSREGIYLSNESICEIMLSCFRICFEQKLNELLRRTAETALKDMVLHLFIQLPNFVRDDDNEMKPFKISGNIMEQCARQISKSQSSIKVDTAESPTAEETNGITTPEVQAETVPLLSTPSKIIDVHGDPTPKSYLSRKANLQRLKSSQQREVSIIGDDSDPSQSGTVPTYHIPCVRELFRFLISLCDLNDKQNTDAMIHTGLCLLMVVFETAADHIGHYPSLLALVQSELCKNLLNLLETDRISILAANLQVCFLTFESMRSYLKFQFEKYLIKLTEIISNENGKIPRDAKELALDNLIQFLRIPGLLSEIYINYDCDFYCANVLKDAIQQLFNYTQSSVLMNDNIFNYHNEALLTIIEMISKFNVRTTNGVAINLDKNKLSINPGAAMLQTTPTGPSCLLNVACQEPKFQIGGKTILTGINRDNLLEIERKKAVLGQGIELFNKHPDRGIQFLQEHNILQSPIDPNEIVLFLREHPQLDKKVIGEFISKKKNVELKILKAYVESFNFTNMPIETSLRSYLAAFRLPGEAPLIFLVLEVIYQILSGLVLFLRV